MSAALVKLPCVLAVSTAFHLSQTAPSKASADERFKIDTFLEGVVMSIAIKAIPYRKLAFWVLGFIEMSAIIFTTLTHNAHIASFLVKDGASLYLTPLSTIGLILVILGTWLRVECYRVMKSLFTFEVSIRKDHKLITSWPYNIVRHPSYLAVLVTHIGMYCWCGSNGSWIRESGILDMVIGRMAVITLASVMMGALVGLIGRIPVEDAAMKKTFGKEWALWVNRVPYKLIPGIY